MCLRIKPRKPQWIANTKQSYDSVLNVLFINKVAPLGIASVGTTQAIRLQFNQDWKRVQLVYSQLALDRMAELVSYYEMRGIGSDFKNDLERATW